MVQRAHRQAIRNLVQRAVSYATAVKLVERVLSTHPAKVRAMITSTMMMVQAGMHTVSVRAMMTRHLLG